MQKLFLRSQAALRMAETAYRRPLFDSIDWSTAPHHYVVVDSAATAHPQRIPLWMFGLLY
jgi:hypothetical protein